ncbi:MAG: T9SS type A sorting domain-containing protein, partial [Candidatus Kapabacteria bacterium]|nr:T9SS type A sorting domain-containing protein [Candidatus Kapabacteria bacterium]
NFIKFKGASTFQFGWLATDVRDEEHNIQILPNPIQDVVHISLTDNEVQKVEFIDVLGNTALTTQHNNATAVHVSVQSLPVGMYHVRITTSTGPVTKQVIVAR